MPPLKLFISYRSSDSAKVDKIALDLGLLKNADGSACFTTWQDKHNLPPASPHWWDAIVEAIEDSDVFVFNLSRASLQSEVCRSEVEFAHKLNLPLVPVVLDGEFFLDPQSGKYSIDYWDLVPEWLRERQFLFYTGADFYKQFQNAISMFQRSWPRRLAAQRPLNPDSKSVQGNNHALYDAACDYAERLALADAEKHFEILVRRNDVDYADVAAQWVEIVRLYAELIEIDERRSARFLFKNRWSAYAALFPKDFLDGLFDPKNFKARLGAGGEAVPSTAPPPSTAPAEYNDGWTPRIESTGTPEPISPQTQAELAAFTRRAAQIKRDVVRSSSDRLPQPFAWIEIPGKGYSIAKYPITNAQFGKFMDADGYNQRQWWTEAGWEAKLKGWAYDRKQNEWVETNIAWTQPRYWTDVQWKGAEQPVVGVSWYEAVAFCLWLSDATQEKIMLPTEDQWQYAAQGDDGRDFPWGKQWDCKKCNNSVKPCASNVTTPVRQFEGKGDSPFGVVDMAGNVWEWCLTDYDSETNDINKYANRRVVHGGSWTKSGTDFFRCDYRDWGSPEIRNYGWGFRICSS